MQRKKKTESKENATQVAVPYLQQVPEGGEETLALLPRMESLAHSRCIHILASQIVKKTTLQLLHNWA